MRYQTPKRVQQLQAQFPELKHIIERFKRGDGPAHRTSILVQRADPAFLYSYAEIADGERNYVAPFNDETLRKGCVATRYQFLFFVEANGAINDEIAYKDFRKAFCIDLLLARTSKLPAINRIILLSVLTWHKEQDVLTAASNLGEYQGTDLEIIIYQAPKCGWYELLVSTDLSKNVPIERMIDVIILGCRPERPDVQRFHAELNKIAKEFSTQVYAKGLKALIDRSKIRGMSGTFNGVELMSWVAAGRVALTLQRGSHDLTFAVAEGEYYNVGLHSMSGTVEEIRSLVVDLTAGWSALNEAERAQQYQDNQKVSLF
ncbi:hypothetical protein C4546_04465 [Candidatus Parcubacteria bacterium]|jgi:hypothetical protein|nr:MAG: hypothetical protein C4546_04465 [Candidatus Parcubacteria bacterium]